MLDIQGEAIVPGVLLRGALRGLAFLGAYLLHRDAGVVDVLVHHEQRIWVTRRLDGLPAPAVAQRPLVLPEPQRPPAGRVIPLRLTLNDGLERVGGTARVSISVYVLVPFEGFPPVEPSGADAPRPRDLEVPLGVPRT
jgi:hypothetical protein